MNDTRPTPTVEHLLQQSTAWIGIGGAVFGVLSFCILLGMWFGPLKNIPSQLESIITRMGELKDRITKQEWAMTDFGEKVASITVQMGDVRTETNKIRDDLRKVETATLQLASTTVSRETFIEWKAALEARNKTISAPPLQSR